MPESDDINEILNDPKCLKVNAGVIVLVGIYEIAKVLTFIGGARDPLAPKLFQLANVDIGEVHWVHGEE